MRIRLLKLLEVIERVTRKIAPGPAPSFNEAHVIKSLELIDHYSIIGRIRLSKELGLGEGITRTLLRRLKNENMIQTARNGLSLSEEAKELLSILQSKITLGIEVAKTPLTVGTFNVGILVRDSAQKVKSGMEQRDTAIMSGALGATTLVFSNKKLTLPIDDQNFSEKMPVLNKQLMIMFNPKENDVIIIGTAETKKLAEIGAKMAVIKLLRNIY